jgi:hypothetical protein
MPKEFYTEKDIEDMAKRGVMSIEVNDNVYLTEVAFEKAAKLGIKVIQQFNRNPSAPIRPYLSEISTSGGGSCTTCSSSSSSQPKALPIQVAGEDLRGRIRSAVLARLGSQVDPVLLDRIIDRVLSNTGAK